MKHLSFALLFLASLGGCLYWDTTPPDQCLAVPQTGAVGVATPLRLVDPTNLQCENFAGASCDPACGPCPLAANTSKLAPLPTWGSCDSACVGLDEARCGATTGCRITRDAPCFFTGGCPSDFHGCEPTDQVREVSGVCADLDAWGCSRHDECAAIYETAACIVPPCPLAFVACAPEHAVAGNCWSPVTCAASPPSCPSGTTAGRLNGCWTGVCVPQQDCAYPGAGAP
jgi:hypothetical protein